MIVDYANVYKAMAVMYHFDPEQVSRMTYAQIDAYLGEKRKLSAAELAAYVEKRNG